MARGRHSYALFSEGRIGSLTTVNRLVRSATWDPSVVVDRRMNSDTLERYRRLAAGGVGTIITGDWPVVPAAMLRREPQPAGGFHYTQAEIQHLGRLPQAVHEVAQRCRIIAQLSRGEPGPEPSHLSTPFYESTCAPLSLSEIDRIVKLFVEAILCMRELGFDGVELHAAHGGLLSLFLSPHTNHRQDAYGGSVGNRLRIIAEIVELARQQVGDYPILIKVNATDYVAGGIEIENFPELAHGLVERGVDALEISGGMWDCLARTETDLGFRPVPSPEAHTGIRKPSEQSYFLPYAERVSLDIPLILVGGNRDVERLERIVRAGQVDFIGMCRPFLAESGLAGRWLAGEGASGTTCISCNSCLYWMYGDPGLARPRDPVCVYLRDAAAHARAQKWLSDWVQSNLRPGWQRGS